MPSPILLILIACFIGTLNEMRKPAKDVNIRHALIAMALALAAILFVTER